MARFRGTYCEYFLLTVDSLRDNPYRKFWEESIIHGSEKIRIFVFAHKIRIERRDKQVCSLIQDLLLSDSPVGQVGLKTIQVLCMSERVHPIAIHHIETRYRKLT